MRCVNPTKERVAAWRARIFVFEHVFALAITGLVLVIASSTPKAVLPFWAHVSAACFHASRVILAVGLMYVGIEKVDNTPTIGWGWVLPLLLAFGYNCYVGFMIGSAMAMALVQVHAIVGFVLVILFAFFRAWTQEQELPRPQLPKLAPEDNDLDARLMSMTQRVFAYEKDVESELTEEPCGICLNHWQDQEHLLQCLCRHVYHEQCIRKWLQRGDGCPMRCSGDSPTSTRLGATLVVVEGETEDNDDEEPVYTSVVQEQNARAVTV